MRRGNAMKLGMQGGNARKDSEEAMNKNDRKQTRKPRRVFDFFPVLFLLVLLDSSRHSLLAFLHRIPSSHSNLTFLPRIPPLNFILAFLLCIPSVHSFLAFLPRIPSLHSFLSFLRLIPSIWTRFHQIYRTGRRGLNFRTLCPTGSPPGPGRDRQPAS